MWKSSRTKKWFPVTAMYVYKNSTKEVNQETFLTATFFLSPPPKNCFTITTANLTSPLITCAAAWVFPQRFFEGNWAGKNSLKNSWKILAKSSWFFLIKISIFSSFWRKKPSTKMAEMKSFDNEGYLPTEPNGSDINSNTKPRANKRSAVEDMSEEDIKAEKRGILKNVFLISFAFLLLFTAFQSMSALQSSINKVSLQNGSSREEENPSNISLPWRYATWALTRTRSSTQHWSCPACFCQASSSRLSPLNGVWWCACFATPFTSPSSFIPSSTRFFRARSSSESAPPPCGRPSAPTWLRLATDTPNWAEWMSNQSLFDSSESFSCSSKALPFGDLSFPPPVSDNRRNVRSQPYQTFFLSVLGSSRNTTINYDADTSQCGVNFCPGPSGCSAEEPEDSEDDNYSISKSSLYIIASVYLACSFLSALIVSLFVDPLSRSVPHSFSSCKTLELSFSAKSFPWLLTSSKTFQKKPLCNRIKVQSC